MSIIILRTPEYPGHLIALVDMTQILCKAIVLPAQLEDSQGIQGHFKSH